MIQKNKTCVVCGKQYTYCSGCGFQEPSYRKSMCSESCRDIYRTLSAYNMDKIDKEEAAARLRACNLSKLNEFKPNIKKEVQAILNAVPKKEAAQPEKESEAKPAVKQEPQKEVKPALPSNVVKAKNNALKDVSQALGTKK